MLIIYDLKNHLERSDENRKITGQEDLVFAEAVFDYYKKQSGFH